MNDNRSTEKRQIRIRDITLVPNLLSLLRIILTPVIGYFLWLQSDRGMIIAMFLLGLAGLTDFLDGYLARRLNQITPLGKALDPIADKIFALILVLELVPCRDFPIWLAAVIISRDLVILLGAAILLRGRDLVIPSNLTGKYYFGSLAVLIFSYVVRFPFGEVLFTYLTLLLLAATMLGYGRIFWVMTHGGELPIFSDRPGYKLVRSILTIIVAAIGLYMFYNQVIVRLIR